MQLSEITQMAIAEGGNTTVYCHADPFEKRPFHAALVRKLALAGAQWGDWLTRDGATWVECAPTRDERVVVFLNAGDVAELTP